MRKADIYVGGTRAGCLEETEKGRSYLFSYAEGYNGPPVSLTMKLPEKTFSFSEFPPFFEGLLPEGIQLEGLLRLRKIDKRDLFSQLLAVGEDLVGTVSVKEVLEEK
jgi:serine/threonine-protein kinase HipA